MGVLRRGDLRDRLLTWTVAGCSLALFLPLAWPLVTGRVFGFDDLGHYHVPLRHLYQEALTEGSSLLWTPALFSGFYLHGEGQVGMLHPWHLLLYRLLPLQVAFNFEFLGSYAAAYGGMYWLLRRLRLTRAGALLGGMLFAFSGFLVMHHPHVSVVAVVAHMPWLLACLDRLITADRPGERAAGYAGSALVLGSALLLGFPQAIWWMLLTASVFALLRSVQARRPLRLISCGTAIITGLLLGGIQVLPTLDAAAGSGRAVVTRAFALSMSLHPWNLVQFWSPYVFVNRAYSGSEVLHVHEYAIYPGTLLVLAPLWLSIRRRTQMARRALIVATASFAALTLVLTLGQYGFLGALLTYLPGVGSFRAPARYIVLVQFALAILAVIAIEDLVTLARHDASDPPPLRLASLAVLCLPALLSMLTTFLLNTHALPVRADLPVGPISQAALGTGIVIAVTIAFVLSARGVRWGVPLLIVLSTADLGFWGLEYVYRDPPQTITSLSRGLPGVTHARVVVAYEDYWMNRPVLKGFKLIGGYAALYPELPLGSPEFLQHAGAQYRIEDDASLAKLPSAASRARLIRERQNPGAPPDNPEAARVLVDRPGRLVVKTSAPDRRLLVTTERFHDGWMATATDGTPLRTFAVDGFVSCIVGGGEHEVEFRFWPRSFVRGCWVTGAGAVLLGFGTVIMRRG